MTFRASTVAASLATAVAVVVVGALVTKTLVEAFTPLSYTIHWRETIPFLVLLTAFALNASWNRRCATRRG